MYVYVYIIPNIKQQREEEQSAAEKQAASNAPMPTVGLLSNHRSHHRGAQVRAPFKTVTYVKTVTSVKTVAQPKVVTLVKVVTLLRQSRPTRPCPPSALSPTTTRTIAVPRSVRPSSSYTSILGDIRL